MLIPDNRDEFRRFSEPEPMFGPAPTALLEGLARRSDCEVHVVSCVKQPVRSPAKIAGNIHYHSLLVPKWGWMRGGYLGCVQAIREKLREIQPGIVHGQGTERYCAFSAACSGFPNVVTIHGNMAELARLFGARPFGFHWLTARLENFTLARTHGVFCNSEYTEHLVAPRARRTWRVPNAIRDAFFDEPRPREKPAKPVILNVGVICPRKRQLEILQALSKLGEDFELHFIGAASPQEGYDEQFSAALETSGGKRVGRALGELNLRELIDAFDGAAALIHFPSEEAFGLVVAEALARDLKFFGARLGGIKDIAAGAAGAELIEADDWTGLRHAVQRWLESGSPRPANRALMRSRYHPDAIAAHHEEIYREVLGGGSAASAGMMRL